MERLPENLIKEDGQLVESKKFNSGSAFVTLIFSTFSKLPLVYFN